MKSSDVEKIESIFKNLKSETEEQVQEMFKDFEIVFTKRERALLMIPGLDIFIIKKAAKRFYSNFKNKDRDYMKSKFSYIFGIEPNFITTFIIMCLFILLSISCITGLNGLLIFFSIMGMLASSLFYFLTFGCNKDMLEASKKDYLTEKVTNEKYLANLNDAINKEDFDKLKKHIDKEKLKKLLVDNDFNISYKALEIFLDETKNKIEKDEKYLKAEEILLSKETVSF